MLEKKKIKKPLDGFIFGEFNNNCDEKILLLKISYLGNNKLPKRL